VGPRAVLVVVALGTLGGGACGTDAPAGGPGTPCTRSKDCAEGLTCTPDGCEGAEAGESDAGPMTDSSAPDAGRVD